MKQSQLFDPKGTHMPVQKEGRVVEKVEPSNHKNDSCSYHVSLGDGDPSEDLQWFQAHPQLSDNCCEEVSRPHHECPLQLSLVGEHRQGVIEIYAGVHASKGINEVLGPLRKQ